MAGKEENTPAAALADFRRNRELKPQGEERAVIATIDVRHE